MLGRIFIASIKRDSHTKEIDKQFIHQLFRFIRLKKIGPEIEPRLIQANIAVSAIALNLGNSKNR